jgi:hypothetical protein
MFNKKILYLFIFLFSFIPALSVKAVVCPVCTIAVTACVGLSRWLGIDDTISGVWMGGLLMSLSIWTVQWLNKKNIRFKGRKITVLLSYYLITIIPLYFINFIGQPYNKIFGIDKLVVGLIIGGISFYAGAKYYQYIKAKNNGHAYFPFQKVVMPIIPLIISSIIFYFLTC